MSISMSSATATIPSGITTRPAPPQNGAILPWSINMIGGFSGTYGSLEDLRANMAFMAERYQKDIILVEVAYNWRTAEYDDEPGPFPETPEGQKQFLEEVDRIVRETPNNRGKGIFWWEPAVSRSPIASRGMFDRSGNALPVIHVFDRFAKAPEEPMGGQ